MHSCQVESRMGVHGLWDILAPVGRSVELKSLEGKILAIDISIWLTQLLRAMGNSNGRVCRRTYLLGMFFRICKMLHHKVLPVFVFDGTAPSVKKKELISRRLGHRRQQRKLYDTARSILVKKMKQHIMESAVKEGERNNEPSELGGFIVDNEEDSKDALRKAIEEDDDGNDICSPWEELLEEVDEKGIGIEDIEEKVVEALPAKLKLRILVKLKEIEWCRNREQTRKESLIDPAAFSRSQTEKLLRINKISKSIRKADGEISSGNIAPELGYESSSLHVGKLDADPQIQFMYMHTDGSFPGDVVERAHNVIDELSKERSEHPIPRLKDLVKGRNTENGIDEDLRWKGEEDDSDEFEVVDLRVYGNGKRTDVVSADKEERENVDAENYGNGLNGNTMENSLQEENGKEHKEVLKRTSTTEYDDSIGIISDNTWEACESVDNDDAVNELKASSVPKEDKNECERDMNGMEEVEDDSDGSVLSRDVDSNSSKQSTLSNEHGEVQDEEESMQNIDEVLEIGNKDFANEKSDHRVNDGEQQHSPKDTDDRNEYSALLSKSDHLSDEIFDGDDLQEEWLKSTEQEFDLQHAIAKLDEEITNLREDKQRLEKGSLFITREILEEIKELLSLFGIPYIESPSEADAQCGFLNEQGIVDGVISNDSDVFLFGSKTVYRNMFSSKSDPQVYMIQDVEKTLGLNRERLIDIALLLGSDYTEGVKHVGLTSAVEILASFPEKNSLQRFAEFVRDESSDSKILFPAHLKKKIVLSETFPEKEVTDAYLYPFVQQSIPKLKWKVPKRDLIVAFANLHFAWDSSTTLRYVDPLIQNAKRIKRSKLDWYMKHPTSVGHLKPVKSKRMLEAIKILSEGKSELELVSKSDASRNDRPKKRRRT